MKRMWYNLTMLWQCATAPAFGYWLSVWWYRYLLSYPRYGWWDRNIRYTLDNIYTILECRTNNHPCGVVWFNPSGFEPDMHCKMCGDDLG